MLITITYNTTRFQSHVHILGLFSFVASGAKRSPHCFQPSTNVRARAGAPCHRVLLVQLDLGELLTRFTTSEFIVFVPVCGFFTCPNSPNNEQGSQRSVSCLRFLQWRPQVVLAHWRPQRFSCLSRGMKTTV